MATDSKIQWTTHTFNPWRGCTKVSEGCKFCYAETTSKRNPKVLGEWGPQGTRVVAAESTWAEPHQWADWGAEGICYHCHGKRKPVGVCEICLGTRNIGRYRPRVFCASLADVFEGPETMPREAWEKVREARVRLHHLINATPQIDWLLLTKRPENIKRFAADENRSWTENMPQNVWLGTSVENQAATVRVGHLIETNARVKFLSCEPLLERVYIPDLDRLQWVIVGGESGSRARPFDVAWGRHIREQCEAKGVSFFMKQLGDNAHGVPGHTPGIGIKLAHKGSGWGDIPENIRVREFPAAA